PDGFRAGDLAQRAVAQHREEAGRFAETYGLAVHPKAKYLAFAHDAGALVGAAYDDDNVAAPAPVWVHAEHRDVRAAIIGADGDLLFRDGRGQIVANLRRGLGAGRCDAEQKRKGGKKASHSQPPST